MNILQRWLFLTVSEVHLVELSIVYFETKDFLPYFFLYIAKCVLNMYLQDLDSMWTHRQELLGL